MHKLNKFIQNIVYILNIDTGVKVYRIGGNIHRKRPAVAVIDVAARCGQHDIPDDSALYLTVVIASVCYLKVVKMCHKHGKHSKNNDHHYDDAQIYPACKPV